MTSSEEKPFVVEYYYKAKWGHADEFLRLFKKNHYPVLKKQVEVGRMLKVWMDQPRYHATEDGRWDYRVTIVFKNATVANEPFDEGALKKRLFPDQETFTHEEQQRFEILVGHWDVPVNTVDLEQSNRMSTRYSSLPLKDVVCLCAGPRDDDAWKEFVSRVGKPIGLTIMRTASLWGEPSRSVVEDLVQKTYVKLREDGCRLLRDFAIQHPEAILAYIKKTAANATHDYFKHRHSQSSGGGTPDLPPGN